MSTESELVKKYPDIYAPRLSASFNVPIENGPHGVFLRSLTFDLEDPAWAFKLAPCGMTARIFINNGKTPHNTENNCFYGEAHYPTLVDPKHRVPSGSMAHPYVLPLNFAIDPEFRLYVSMDGHPPDTRGWRVIVGNNSKY